MSSFDLILGLVGLSVAGFVGLFLWTRRGQGQPDHPGARTACTFHGGNALRTERERARERRVGEVALGDGVSAALAERLQAMGVHVLARDHEEYGWGMNIARDGVQASLHVGAVPDDQDRDLWLLRVSDASSGGPGPDALLPVVDRALHQIPQLTSIQWHAREQLGTEAPLAGEEAPLDQQ